MSSELQPRLFAPTTMMGFAVGLDVPPASYHVQTPLFNSNFLASARGAREWSSRCAGWAGGGLAAFFRISEASVGRGGPLRASLSTTAARKVARDRALFSAP